MTNARNIARICKVLSSDVRVRIIELLQKRPLCVGAISRRLDVTQGAVSQHLRILREAHLVAAEKKGYFVHYRLDRKTFSKWKDLIGRLAATGPADRT